VPVNSPSYFPGVRTLQEARSVAVSANELLSGIDFTLATPIGVRVRGRVVNLPTTFPADWLYIRLERNNGTGTGRPVPRDGRFEFFSVLPGQYYLRVMGRNTPLSPHNPRVLPGEIPPARIDVSNREVDDVAVPAGTFALGRASVDDGSTLPFLELALIVDTAEPRSSITVSGGGPEGRFIVPVGELSPANYTIIPRRLTLGYYVKSISPGNADLQRSEIEVVLSKTPPPGSPEGVRISGRVTRLEHVLPGGDVALALESSPTMTNPTAILGSTTANKDGTFEFRSVPPDAMFCAPSGHEHQESPSRLPTAILPTSNSLCWPPKSDSCSASASNSAGRTHVLHASRCCAAV
jgi:hypothetical protein